MMYPIRKTHIILKPMNYSLIDLPTPPNLSFMWNWGSLLGLCLFLQMLTGLLLTMHYTPHINLAFDSISHITRETNNGWLMRNLHANGASLFFLCLYLHMGRSIYFKSFMLSETWNIGVTILLMSMATAFMGYLLPWGQMSFWGATVITNLFSAIPYVGKPMVEWLWGGFGISNPTLMRFFALHYAMPAGISIMVLLHIMFLHKSGSNNPLGITSNMTKTPFHPYFSTKDTMGFMVLLSVLSLLSFFLPHLLTDPENFIPANPLVTPTHIKPEWYFLWAYAILRSIPNKLGGVVMMFAAILLLYFLPLMKQTSCSSSMMKINQYTCWLQASTMFMLTWLGAQPVEPPYESLGLTFTSLYFLTFLFLFLTS